MKVAALTLEDGTTISGPSAQALLKHLGSAAKPAARRVKKKMAATMRMPAADREAWAERNMGLTFQRPGRRSNTMYTLIGWSTDRIGEDGMTLTIALLTRADGTPIRVTVKRVMDEMRPVTGRARFSTEMIHELRTRHAGFLASQRVKSGFTHTLAEAS